MATGDKLVSLDALKAAYDDAHISTKLFGVKQVTGAGVPFRQINGVSYARPGNLVDPAECVNNAYVYTSGTNEGNIRTSQPNYFCTGYIPVVAGTKYKANMGRNFAFYDANKAVLAGNSMAGANANAAMLGGLTAPANAAYFRYTITKATDGTENPDDLYFAAEADYDDSISCNWLRGVSEYQADLAARNPWCYGKTIAWYGDSIVAGASPKRFDEYVCESLNMTKIEHAWGGATIAATGTDRKALVLEAASADDSDADIIAVSGGTNDWFYALNGVGDMTSTGTDTFYGALKTLCETLLTKYPQKVIFFTTPIKRAQPFETGGDPTTPTSVNANGKTLMEYADIIKEVCAYYSIPVLDMYRESGLNPHLAAQQSLFDDVLTHPTDDGRKIMARRVAGWLAGLCRNI